MSEIYEEVEVLDANYDTTTMDIDDKNQTMQQLNM